MHVCLFHGMRTAALLTFGVSQGCLIPGVADLSFCLSVCLLYSRVRIPPCHPQCAAAPVNSYSGRASSNVLPARLLQVPQALILDTGGFVMDSLSGSKCAGSTPMWVLVRDILSHTQQLANTVISTTLFGTCCLPLPSEVS